MRFFEVLDLKTKFKSLSTSGVWNKLFEIASTGKTGFNFCYLKRENDKEHYVFKLKEQPRVLKAIA